MSHMLQRTQIYFFPCKINTALCKAPKPFSLKIGQILSELYMDNVNYNVNQNDDFVNHFMRQCEPLYEIT